MGRRVGRPRSNQDEVCAVTTTRLVTADEFFAMPDDGYSYELVEGKLVKMAAAGTKHGKYAADFVVFLGHYVRSHRMGIVLTAEAGFRLASDPDTVRVPDVAFLDAGRLREVGIVDGFWTGAPDLAVEVKSPSDTYAQVERKALAWIEAGCRAVVTLDPRRETVRVYRPQAGVVTLTRNDALEVEEVLPGWSLPLNELFSLADIFGDSPQ